jgi:hypothetical protein
MPRAFFSPGAWHELFIMGMKKEISHELPQSTAGYPAIGHSVIYPTLGLANESGKVAGKVKN